MSNILGKLLTKSEIVLSYCTVAHTCHGKTYFFAAKLTLSRQNLLFHGKTYFSTAKLTFSYFRNPVSLGLQFPAILDPGTSDCTPADLTWRIRKKISCKYVKT